MKNNYNYKIVSYKLIAQLIVIFLITISFSARSFGAEGYEYKLIETPNQKIHLVKVDLNRYQISLASAHDSVFGRETTGSIADRYQAEIAVNSGFFQIGNNEDGRPTGTLIINGEIFSLKTAQHAVFVLRDQHPSIEIWNPQISLKIGSTEFTPDRYNKFADQNATVFYSSKWGPATLTAYATRKEVIISKNMVVESIENHGNNRIPADGYVLSLAKNYDISSIKVNDVAAFNQEGLNKFADSSSAVMGIPSLIIDGKINDKLSNSEKHARTAIGVDKDGKVILAVVECNYEKSLSSLTLKETQEIFRRKNISIDDLKVDAVKKILAKELSSKNMEAQGLGMKELADFMLAQGCVSAINLDGGGSSSLYINGKYINRSVGDKDEAEGIQTVRPVSDVILFKKKP